MIHLLILAMHLLATIAKLVRPGGVRAVVAESLVLKQQLLISSRARRRAPNLNAFDRFLLGLGSLFVPASRIPKLAFAGQGLGKIVADATDEAAAGNIRATERARSAGPRYLTPTLSVVVQESKDRTLLVYFLDKKNVSSTGMTYYPRRWQSLIRKVRRTVALWPYRPAAFSFTYSRIILWTAGGRSGAANIR